jgi:hypothetical protein
MERGHEPGESGMSSGERASLCKPRCAGWLVTLSAALVASAPSIALAALFDDYELAPRARGLGGSYAGISDDAIGVFYNPAGLVNLESLDLYASAFELWGQGFLRINAFAAAMPLERFGTVGVGYNDFRVEVDDATLSVERTVSFSHGLRLMEDISSSISFGYSVSIYNVDYPTRSVSDADLGSETTFGIDMGVQAKLRDRTTAGVFFKNVNNPEIGDPATDLSRRVSGGVAYRPYEGVITAGEIEKSLGEDVQFRGGVEFEVAPVLTLRFGGSSKPNLFDVGAGVQWSGVKVDFAYTYHPVLDATLHFGLGYRL